MHFFPNFKNTSDFEDVVKLKIDNTQIKQIFKEDLTQFPSLTHLEINDNDLTEFPKDLFENNKMLSNIRLIGNKFQNIELENFYGNLTIKNDESYVDNLKLQKITLENQVKNLKKEKTEQLKKFEHGEKTKNQQIKSLNTKLDGLQNDKNNLTKMFQICEVSKTEIQKENMNLTVQTENLKDQIEKFKLSENSLKENNEKLTIEIEGLEKQIQTLKNGIELSENPLIEKVNNLQSTTSSTQNIFSSDLNIHFILISIFTFVFLETLVYAIYKCYKQSSSNETEEIHQFENFPTNNPIYHFEKASQIEVNDYEVPLPYEDHIYDEINLNNIRVTEN
ncbi:hypothetical protein PVAND_015466 [Polypedilum vanderplanki]|uniref:Leucine rich repeat protein n=1 Tax=Polypedilum vanderplanki TaxID=319348 RepID=A0A9J6BD53_POLVA|nr:hypothetical protein PVAND_015466 [Polypedilum vanderplanki]